MYNNNFNNNNNFNYGGGYTGGFNPGYGSNQPPKQVVNMGDNTLSSAEMTELAENPVNEELNLQLPRKTFLRELCNHKKGGALAIYEDMNGDHYCEICKKKIVTPNLSDEEIADAINILDMAMDSIKLGDNVLSSDIKAEFYKMWAYVKHDTLKVHSVVKNSVAKYGQQNAMNRSHFFGRSSNNPFDMLNGLLDGYNGQPNPQFDYNMNQTFNNNGYGNSTMDNPMYGQPQQHQFNQPMYGQPNPQYAPEYMNQPQFNNQPGYGQQYPPQGQYAPQPQNPAMYGGQPQQPFNQYGQPAAPFNQDVMVNGAMQVSGDQVNLLDKDNYKKVVPPTSPATKVPEEKTESTTLDIGGIDPKTGKPTINA